MKTSSTSYETVELIISVSYEKFYYMSESRTIRFHIVHEVLLNMRALGSKTVEDTGAALRFLTQQYVRTTYVTSPGMDLLVVVFHCCIIFSYLCCRSQHLSPLVAMEFVSLARSRRSTKIANLKGNKAGSNAGTVIRKAGSDKVRDATNAEPSSSPAKESIAFSVPNDSQPTFTEQQVTSPMTNRYACPDDCDPYVWYGDVREYIAIHCAPPVIDYSLLKGSDFSSDSEDDSGDDRNAKPSYSPAKESSTSSVSNDVTDPQEVVENEQRKICARSDENSDDKLHVEK